ncbi:MAG: hypothetical protein QM627_07215 [Luteolibacter sp.]
MKSPLPIICGIALAAMSSAAFSHWWTLRETLLADAAAPLPMAPPQPVPDPPAAQPSPTPATPSLTFAEHSPATPEVTDSQRAFYEGMLAEMRKLRTENRDLLDQIAETNRDLMKLEFRVDTHSESFRPLPISEERMETSFDNTSDEDGVLPPRAEPVVPLPVPLPSRQR